MKNDSFYSQVLNELAAKNIRRALKPNGTGINFVHNDYLGLKNHPEIAEAAALAYRKWGSGSGGSRLLGGNPEIFERAETELARWKGTEAALLFNCGYSANVGLVSALCNEQTTLFMDKLNHASIVDGYRQSNAKLVRFPHHDTDFLETALKKTSGRKIIYVESVYSMDGDLAPLRDYADLAEKSSALLVVDEAHGEGIFGPDGKGLVHELGLENRVDLVLGTFGKAYGTAGACVWGSRTLIDYLVNKARSFIYSTALPPGVVASMLKAVEVAVRESWRRERALTLAAAFREKMNRNGWNTLKSASQIVPLVIGSSEKCISVSEKLSEKGLWTAAVREPTVPAGTARLRINFTASHQEKDLEMLVSALESWRTEHE
ncbi:MAG: 8-amino-7-oxononanoate synthase [Fibrobacter sp.]|jgi:8-amino-7-oxononanoate synthase|nr:8-amino-7-oxononanoate synthase [Fibrobacter sp.]